MLPDLLDDNPYRSPQYASDAVAQRLAEVGAGLDPRIRYRLETIFPEREGWLIARQIANKHKLLRRIEPRLLDALLPDEEVLYVVHCHEADRGRGLFRLTRQSRAVALIATARRFVVLALDYAGRPKDQAWAIHYDAIERVRSRWPQHFSLRLRDGLRLRYIVEWADRRHLPDAIALGTAEAAEASLPPPTQCCENLCNDCGRVVPAGSYTCAGCGARYWLPRELALRSLVLPPWGEALRGLSAHWAVGCVAYSLVLLMWVAAVAAAAAGVDVAVIAAGLLPLGLCIIHLVSARLAFVVADASLATKEPGKRAAATGEERSAAP